MAVLGQSGTEPMRRGWCRGVGDRASVVDFNGNGVEDLACQSASGDIRVLLSTPRGLVPASGRDDGLLLSRWCRSAEADLVWADLDGNGRGDALCLRREGRHSAMLSTGAALIPAGRDGDGLLVDDWCRGQTVRALLAAAPGDGSIELRCAGVGEALRLHVQAPTNAAGSHPNTGAQSPRQWAQERGLQLPVQARGGGFEPTRPASHVPWLLLAGVALVLLSIIPFWRRSRSARRTRVASLDAMKGASLALRASAVGWRRDATSSDNAHKPGTLILGVCLCLVAFPGVVAPSTQQVHGSDRADLHEDDVILATPAQRPEFVLTQQAATLRDR